MILSIPDLLKPDDLREARAALLQARWVDGRSTAGHRAVLAKRNLQLAADDPLALRIGDLILKALGADPRFLSATLPLKIFPPRFNRYAEGGAYDEHIDNAVLTVPGTPHRVRSDVSATLFFSDPDEYDGGELTIEDSFGAQRVKLPAGHLVVYPGTSLHRVTPVTRGARLASFFWIQSLIREDAQRTLLHQLDQTIQSLTAREPDSPELSSFIGVYHNLVRRWSDT